MRKPTATAPSVPLGRKMNPSKTSPQAKTAPPAKASSPVKTSPPEKTSHPAKTNPPAPQPKSAVTAVEMGARHMRKPTKKAPSAKRGRKLKPSKSSPPEKTSPPAKTDSPAKTNPPAPPPKPAVTAVELGARQPESSVSEFFTKNRHLLGFDNPRKALLTCVKEAVDNALDACEEAGILPDVVIKVEVAANGESAPPASQATRFRITVTANGPGTLRQ